MNTNNQYFDVLFVVGARDLLKEDIEIAHSTDIKNTIISKRVLLRIRRKIKAYDIESRWLESVPKLFRRIVVAILVACTVSFGMCMSVQAIRGEIIDTILKYYDEFVAVFFVTEEKPPNTIEVFREPELYVNGTERNVAIQVDEIYLINYFRNGELVIEYKQMLITEGVFHFDSENCEVSNIKISGGNAYLLNYKDGKNAITWHDDQYAYSLISFDQSIEENILIKIAESVE